MPMPCLFAISAALRFSSTVTFLSIWSSTACSVDSKPMFRKTQPESFKALAISSSKRSTLQSILNMMSSPSSCMALQNSSVFFFDTIESSSAKKK